MCEKRWHILLAEQVKLVPFLLHVNELVDESPLGPYVPQVNLFPILLLVYGFLVINAHGKCKG